MAIADQLLNSVYQTLNIVSASDLDKYSRIDDIIRQLQIINDTNPINVKTTGTISERLCELALKTATPTIYNSLSSDWKWIGDFSILGNPFNLIISVKSFKAKERLMASGSGNILSPTIGWGLFDDINEWTEDRIKAYLFRAFIAIYVPQNLFQQLPPTVINILNVNNKAFIRPLNTMIGDLTRATSNGKIDIKKI